MRDHLADISFPPLEIKQFDVQARYNLPSDVQFCVRCVISNQRPRIGFDADGVCSACRYAEVKHSLIDWEQRSAELTELCNRFRRTDGQFDVLVPSSGGKDSGYVAHLLKTQYDMHPLLVTWAPHWYTDVGYRNLQALVHSGFNNITFTPDGVVHRTLTRLAFSELGDPFQPFIYGQKNFPLHAAAKFGIPLIMFGENGEVEYGGDMKNANSPTHDTSADMTQHYFSGVQPSDWARYGIVPEALKVYEAPPQEDIERVGVECHFMGYYKKWIPQELYYYCSENVGFEANVEGRSEGTYSKYASLDDRLDGFHYYLAFIKFGLGRATSDAAHEIRDGHLERDEGLALVQKFDGEFPSRHFANFLRYTGISPEEFEEIIDGWRSPHLWESGEGGWRLKHAVWHDRN